MKKISILLVSMAIFLVSCTFHEDHQNSNTIIEMTLNENYSDRDPFVNARLFCVKEDVEVLNTIVVFEMQGEHGVVEIKNNQTGEILWSKTWKQGIDHESIAVSLAHVQKANEYVIQFTGIAIQQALVRVTFLNDMVQEKERPSR